MKFIFIIAGALGGFKKVEFIRISIQGELDTYWYTVFFVRNSIFELSLELLIVIFKVAQNSRVPLLQIDLKTISQSEFYHLVLVKENLEKALWFPSIDLEKSSKI